MVPRRSLEHRRQRPLSPAEFRQRLTFFVLVAAGLVLAALGIGMVGYRAFEHWCWTDAFLNASMILSGMGPVDHCETEGGKIFAGIYALLSGTVFLAVIGLVFGPLIHRLLHKFHFDEDDLEDPKDGERPTDGDDPSS